MSKKDLPKTFRQNYVRTVVLEKVVVEQKEKIKQLQAKLSMNTPRNTTVEVGER